MTETEVKKRLGRNYTYIFCKQQWKQKKSYRRRMLFFSTPLTQCTCFVENDTVICKKYKNKCKRELWKVSEKNRRKSILFCFGFIIVSGNFFLSVIKAFSYNFSCLWKTCILELVSSDSTLQSICFKGSQLH